MTETIYVVSAGSYSDYRVLCACPTKRDADAVAAKIRASDSWKSDARVETLEMVSADVQQVAILRLSETLWDDGTVSEYRDTTAHEWPFDGLYGDGSVAVRWRWVRAPCHNGIGGRLEVSGVDHERVRRVFSERKALVRTDDAFRAKSEAKGR
jgi:hypothetical protein